MSVHSLFTPIPECIENSYFSLAIRKNFSQIAITMQSLTPFVTTHSLPQVSKLARKHIPDIFLTECFNYDNLPFSEEIKGTEVAHLFEHILITLMCSLQGEKGNYDAVYTGNTSWNWMKEKRGTFHITIPLAETDYGIFQQSLKKSIAIMEIMYLAHETHPQKRQIIN